MVPSNLIGCIGSFRLQCGSCGHYFSFDESCGHECICPSCKNSFGNLLHGLENGLVREAPWWHGKDVPEEIITISEFHLYKPVEKIPQFYIDVHIFFMGQFGIKVSEEDALQYLYAKIRRRAGWGMPTMIVLENEEWVEELIDEVSKTKREEMLHSQRAKEMFQQFRMYMN